MPARAFGKCAVLWHFMRRRIAAAIKHFVLLSCGKANQYIFQTYSRHAWNPGRTPSRKTFINEKNRSSASGWRGNTSLPHGHRPSCVNVVPLRFAPTEASVALLGHQTRTSGGGGGFFGYFAALICEGQIQPNVTLPTWQKKKDNLEVLNRPCKQKL